MKLKEYFYLQQRLFNRSMIDFGLNPYVGYILLVIAFIALSFYLFVKTVFAKEIYCISTLHFVHQMGDVKRNEFLNSIFSKKDYLKVRMAENLLISLPFVVFLCFKLSFLYAGITLTGAAALIFLDRKSRFDMIIPTPFFWKPYEFIVGFRKMILIILFFYFLIVMAVLYSNFNLGAFALLFLYFLAMAFYSEAESESLVWVYSDTSTTFLLKKIKTATLQALLLAMPAYILLIIFFPEMTKWVILIQPLGVFYIWVVILAKYASFTNRPNFIFSIILALCICFPFILAFFIPFFYRKSIEKLKPTLG